MTDTLCPLSADSRLPVPDPTSLTTAALHREVATLSETFERRLEAVDRDAVSLNRERTEQFAALKELMGERLTGLQGLVDEKFDSAERQRAEQKSDTKQAVDAALSAAKEAVKEQTTASGLSISKSEAATAAQLKQMQETFATAIEGLRRSLDELKDRAAEDARNLRESISAVAAIANGTVQRTTGAKEDRTGLYATIGMVATVILLAIAIIGFELARSAP